MVPGQPAPPVHWFTVDDLMYLKRGGRVSAATALVGTMLSIKPVLHVDDEGHLINVGKARGRKSSIQALADKMGQLQIPGENDTVFICHGDCIEDAKYLESLVKERYGVKNVLIYYTGAVIASHSGPALWRCSSSASIGKMRTQHPINTHKKEHVYDITGNHHRIR